MPVWKWHMPVQHDTTEAHASPLVLYSECMSNTVFLKRQIERVPYQVYLPANYVESQRWPVILFLHGAGERGSDGLKQTKVGIGRVLEVAKTFPFIVVLPQCPSGANWTGAVLDSAVNALDATANEFDTDNRKIYATGISMGGAGVLELALKFPSRFAAYVPVCGFMMSRDPEACDKIAAAIGTVPTWLFHGADDNIVPASESRKVYNALLRAGRDVRYTEYPGVGHNCWNRAYTEAEFVPWLLSKSKAK
jgi:predicted peptidase